MAIPFEPGTRVRLKFGGPDMMVVGEAADIGYGERDDVLCEWQGKAKGQWKSGRRAFASTSLEVVPPDSRSFNVMG